MEYNYQWPIFKEPPPVMKSKKRDDGSWGRSATRCMRRRGFFPPPSNYYPRGHGPQMHSTPFRSYEHSWKPENPEHYFGMGFEKPKAFPPSSFKKRPCSKRGYTKAFKPCDYERGYYPGASPQHIGGRYFGGPFMNDAYFDAFQYPHHGVKGYDPFFECSNGFGRFYKSPAPMQYIEESVDSPKCPASCDDILSTAMKEVMEEPLSEVVNLPVPSADTCKPAEVFLGLPKDEADSAVRTLEELFPSLRSSCAKEPGKSHGFLNPIENPGEIPEEPKQECESGQEGPLLPPIQLQSSLSSVEQSTELTEKVGDSKPSTVGSVTQDSVQFLVNQNQFLSDVLSQVMSGEFDLNQSFLEKYQSLGEVQNGNAARADERPSSSLFSPAKTTIKEKNVIQDIIPFNDPCLGKPLLHENETGCLSKELNIESEELNCNLSSIDWDSFAYIFDKHNGMNCAETTQGCSYTPTLLEPSLPFTNPDSISEATDSEFLKCVNPNAVLPEKKRPRKRMKREQRAKRVRQNNRKNDEEEKVQSLGKTDVYTSTETSEVRESRDAQTQVDQLLVPRVDSETQWLGTDVGIGVTSLEPLVENLSQSEESKSNIDVDYGDQEFLSMPKLEHQTLVARKEIGKEDCITSPEMDEDLRRSLRVSVMKEEKCCDNEAGDIKLDGATKFSENENKTTDGLRYATENVSDRLSDVLNLVSVENNQDHSIRVEAYEQNIQHSKNLEVAAYEECSNEIALPVSASPTLDAMETGKTTFSEMVRKCAKSCDRSVLKSNEANLESLETIPESGVKCLNEKKSMESDSNVIFLEDAINHQNQASLGLEMINQETLQLKMSENEAKAREEPITMEENLISDMKELIDVKIMAAREKSNCGLLRENKNENIPLDGYFQADLDRSCKLRTRKKTALEKQKNDASSIQNFKSPDPDEIETPPKKTKAQKRTSGPVSSEPSSKKTRRASLKCRKKVK